MVDPEEARQNRYDDGWMDAHTDHEPFEPDDWDYMEGYKDGYFQVHGKDYDPDTIDDDLDEGLIEELEELEDEDDLDDEDDEDILNIIEGKDPFGDIDDELDDL